LYVNILYENGKREGRKKNLKNTLGRKRKNCRDKREVRKTEAEKITKKEMEKK